MPKLKRNDQQIRAAKPIDGKPTRYSIEGVPGLILAVSPTSKHWGFRYKIGKGRAGTIDKYIAIGALNMISLADATQRARVLYFQVKIEGRDPHLERAANSSSAQKSAYTLRQLINDFLSIHAKALKANTARQYEYRLRSYVEPELGDMLADQVKKRDVIELADGIAEEGKIQKQTQGRGSKGGERSGGATRLADGVVEIMSSMYGWAQKRDLVESNPAFRLPKYHKWIPQDRVLQDMEFPIFWSGVERNGIAPAITTILRLLLLTGQRRSEVAGALASEFDFASINQSWTIRAERTKNGIAHTVPLAPLAADLWRLAIQHFCDGTYVFPALRMGDAPHVHPGAVTGAMRRVRINEKLEDLTVHDLRRTVRTRMASLGIPREHSSRVLNHSEVFDYGVHDAAYNRYEYFVEKLEALRKWERLLHELLAGKKQMTFL